MIWTCCSESVTLNSSSILLFLEIGLQRMLQEHRKAPCSKGCARSYSKGEAFFNFPFEICM